MEGCFSSRIDALVSESEGKQAKSKSFLLPCPYIDFDEKMWSRLEVSFPSSNDVY